MDEAGKRSLTPIAQCNAIDSYSLDCSIFCLCSEDDEDILWTQKLIKHLNVIGLRDIHSTLLDTPGFVSGKKLQCCLKSVNRLVIVLSPTSNQNIPYLNTVECSIIFVLKENSACRIIPVLLSVDTELPFSLLNREPFLAWKSDMCVLVNSLFNTQEHLKSYVYNIIQVFQKGQYLRHLNSSILPQRVSTQVQELGLSVLEWWGMLLCGNKLTVNMNKVQGIGSFQKILLHDLFTGLFETRAIRFIRVTGFDAFNYEKFKGQKDLFDDLVNFYIAIFSNMTTNQKRGTFWYNYRRNGISHTANMAIYPISKAITSVHSNNYHSPEFDTEESRFKTFKNFPIKNECYRSKLAKAGFYYFEYLDYVQCFCCGGCMRTWALNRNPITRHSSLFPLCPHVQELIACDTTFESSDLICKLKEDQSQISDDAAYKHDDQERDVKLQFSQHYNKQFCDYESRLASLEKFKQNTQNCEIEDCILQRYAEAGFYHYGIKEDILCFSCNLGLTEIKQNVNPWIVHSNLSLNCLHIQQHKKTLKDLAQDQNDVSLDSFIEYEFKSRD